MLIQGSTLQSLEGLLWAAEWLPRFLVWLLRAPAGSALGFVHPISLGPGPFFLLGQRQGQMVQSPASNSSSLSYFSVAHKSPPVLPS